MRYMHRNPVKRGLVNAPEQWRWSSYRFYFMDDAGPVRVNEGWTRISFAAPVQRLRRDQTTLRPRFAVPTLSQKARKNGAPTLFMAASEVNGPTGRMVQRPGHPSV